MLPASAAGAIPTDVSRANGNRTDRLPVQASAVGAKCLQSRSPGIAGMLQKALRICDVVTWLSLGDAPNSETTTGCRKQFSCLFGERHHGVRNPKR
jgi:hypothetical protein